MQPLTREEVYQLIDGERNFQDSEFPNRREAQPLTIGESLLLLDVYIARAKDTWQGHGGQQAALDIVRKIAGIAVHCMENHGAPPRQVPQ